MNRTEYKTVVDFMFAEHWLKSTRCSVLVQRALTILNQRPLTPTPRWCREMFHALVNIMENSLAYHNGAYDAIVDAWWDSEEFGYVNIFIYIEQTLVRLQVTNPREFRSQMRMLPACAGLLICYLHEMANHEHLGNSCTNSDA